MSRGTKPNNQNGLPRGGFLWGEPPRYGQVRLVAPSSSLIPISPTDRGKEVDAVICPATFEATIPDTGIIARFLTKPVRGRAAIKTITFTLEEADNSTTFLTGLDTDCLKALLAACTQVATVRATRSRDGTLQRVRTPSGGRGKGRINERPWNAPTEIARVVELMQQAEAGYKNGTHKHLNTKLKREAWVAKKTRTWSAGTVHLQLQIARDQGLLTPKGRQT